MATEVFPALALRLGDLGQDPAPTALRLTTLVGRDGEVAEVLELMSRLRLLTLTGPPGVGKSRLAMEAATKLVEYSRGRVVIVSLGSLTGTDQAESTVAEALSRGTMGERSGAGQAGDRGLIVVLDDCDRVLGACAEVAEALLGRGLSVLATAREPLGVDGEAVWRVPPLSLPRTDQDTLPDVFTDSEAVQLFCARAASSDRGFLPMPENAAAIAQICRRLDGIPLAIELAARAVSAYSPADIAARLVSPFTLLTVGVRTAHPRHHSLEACLAWSFDLLSASERSLLARLAVFSASFSDRAAARVCAGGGLDPEKVSTLLRALVDKSLLEVEAVASEARYRLLETMRCFATQALEAAGEEDAVRARHAQWCAALVEGAGDARRVRVWVERLQPYHQDIHAALEWTLSRHEGGTAVILGFADSWLCPAEGHHQQARQRMERVAVAAFTAPAPLRAQALSGAAVAEIITGKLARAVTHLHEAVAVADEAGEAVQGARAHQALRFVEVLEKGHPSSVAALAAAVARARAVPDPTLAADALAALGRAHLLVGNPAAAHGEFAESLELSRRFRDQAGEAQALVGLGRAELALGNYGGADALLWEGLKLVRAQGELHAAGVALAGLGESARVQGEATVAQICFSQAAEIAREQGHPYPLAQALLGLGRLALEHGDSAAARECFREALTTARTSSIAHLLAASLCGMAQVASDSVTARSLVEQAVTAAKQCGDKAGEAGALDSWGRLHRDGGDVRGAIARHRQALLLHGEIGDPAAVANGLEELAKLAEGKEDFSIAARLLGAAEALRDSHGCVRPASRVAEHTRVLAAVRQALGQQSFDEEWRQGRVLSMRTAVAYAARQRGRRVPRPSTGWEALTGAERRAAVLAVQGYTNAGIARELSIAPATVKAHLRRVFAKVGVETRSSLAAEMHRARPAWL